MFTIVLPSVVVSCVMKVLHVSFSLLSGMQRDTWVQRLAPCHQIQSWILSSSKCQRATEALWVSSHDKGGRLIVSWGRASLWLDVAHTSFQPSLVGFNGNIRFQVVPFKVGMTNISCSRHADLQHLTCLFMDYDVFFLPRPLQIQTACVC